MVALHMRHEKPQTKLGVLQQAVTLITTLEQQVRGMRVTLKCACPLLSPLIGEGYGVGVCFVVNKVRCSVPLHVLA